MPSPHFIGPISILKTASQTILVLIVFVMLSSCEEKEQEPTPSAIFYKTDGRSVYVGDVEPIALDVNEDGSVDFTIFVELTANRLGDHLYVGINPININAVKSGPPNDDHFLNMGFAPAEIQNNVIHHDLTGDVQWTADHSILLIRHTSNDNTVWYEGDWKSGEQALIAIRHMAGDATHYGWLNLQFNKETEYITLVDYAYNLEAGKSIRAGQKN